MKLRLIPVLGLSLVLLTPIYGQDQTQDAPQAGAQDPPSSDEASTEAIGIRVIQVRVGGEVVIDRGASDGLQARDRVVLHPLGSRSLHGRVLRVTDRSADVQLADRNARVAVGVRGVVHLPSSRFEVEPDPVPPLQDEEPEMADPAEVPEHAPWEYEDGEFEEGMPLLMEIDGVRPEQRDSLISGRIYTIVQGNKATADGRSDSFWRFGSDVHYENPFGRGGEFIFEGEVNYRHTEVDEQVDESRSRARIDRVSYSWGGTRFDRDRHEVGRFLHHGVPEFGVIDGYEWGHRFDSGSRMGASVGYLPEPTPSMQTGEDFSASAFYQWAADQREEWLATAAYQKSWHNGAADRDLFVTRLDHWATEGWDFHGSAWVDYYTGGDEAKGAGFEVTRLIVSTGKRFEGGDGLEFTLVHNRFPEIDRFEFLPLLNAQLADNRTERLSAEGWTWIERERRLFGEVGVWFDQDDDGGDAELGVEELNLFLDNSRARASVYGTDGKFSTLYGLRLAYGIQANRSRWDLSYEYFQSDQVGFTSENDNIEQHRIVASTDYQSTSGWSVSLHAGASFWTEEVAVAAGLYIQRSF